MGKDNKSMVAQESSKIGLVLCLLVAHGGCATLKVNGAIVIVKRDGWGVRLQG